MSYICYILQLGNHFNIPLNKETLSLQTHQAILSSIDYDNACKYFNISISFRFPVAILPQNPYAVPVTISVFRFTPILLYPLENLVTATQWCSKLIKSLANQLYIRRTHYYVSSGLISGLSRYFILQALQIYVHLH